MLQVQLLLKMVKLIYMKIGLMFQVFWLQIQELLKIQQLFKQLHIKNYENYLIWGLLFYMKIQFSQYVKKVFLLILRILIVQQIQEHLLLKVHVINQLMLLQELQGKKVLQLLWLKRIWWTLKLVLDVEFYKSLKIINYHLNIYLQVLILWQLLSIQMSLLIKNKIFLQVFIVQYNQILLF